MINARPTASLEERFSRLEQEVRSRSASDQPVVDPTTGIYVPLSVLAFGRQAASAVGTVSLSSNDQQFYPDPNGLEVWAQVYRGELLVEVAARLVVSGNKATMSMSSTIEGPYLDRTPAENPSAPLSPIDGVTPTTIAGDANRALSVLMDDSGQSQSLAAGFPFAHTGLTPGWYRVRPVYNLSGAVGQPNGISGSATARTVIADPR